MTSDTGIASAGTIVARMFRRNRKMMTVTSPQVSSSVSSVSVMDRRTNTDWSKAVSRSTPGGSAASMAGSSRWIASDTSMMFALDWRTIPTATAWVPL